MKRTKGFSYDTETDMDVIKHIKKQPHEANYIWGLVRQDMNEDSDINIKKLVKRYVEEILKEKNIPKVRPNGKPIAKMIDVQQLLNIN